MIFGGLTPPSAGKGEKKRKGKNQTRPGRKKRGTSGDMGKDVSQRRLIGFYS